MTQTQTPTTTPNDLLQLAKKHPVRWLAPALLATIAATAYATLRPAVWEASQALTVRDEASAAAPDHLGKFHVVDDMKTVQETLLELTKSRGLLTDSLKEVGPPSDPAAAWPTDADVTALQAGVKLSPPKGAEFGKTEVFYLQVQSTDRQRAVLLATALSDQLKQRFDDLRDARAQSLINELSKTVILAQADVKTAADRLAKIDAEAGPDLGELRTLADELAGESPLRRSLSEMETELRGARTAQDANAALLKVLENSKNDPAFLASAPAKLLESQPALKKLKDALMDAQLTTARLLGSLDEAHPSVQAAKSGEAEITQHVHEEVAAAIRGVTIDQRLLADRSATLEKQLAEAKARLNKLAAMRTDYAGLAAEVHRRTDTLKAAENQLAEARAIEAGAHTASLITAIDKPENGAESHRLPAAP